jgi:hypothetical protein
MKKQIVELFCDGFERLVYHWWRYMQNGGGYVEK